MTLSKRRTNNDCGRGRKAVKRTKIPDGFLGSTMTYVKLLLVWSTVMLADFALEFRFEYMWPFWLFLLSAYESFKYQGTMFSLFFVCVAVSSDVACYLFIPIQWLFFAASTYVWVQYVWHPDRGVCWPTVSLWILVLYVEWILRLRDHNQHLPFGMDLSRPFAAHCIGYPVVTLGFDFRTYISYKLRLRKQRLVEKENEFFTHLLQQALPQEIQNFLMQEKKAIKKEEEGLTNGTAGGAAPLSKKSSSTRLESVESKLEELEYIEQSPPNGQSKQINNCHEEKLDNYVNDTHARNMQRAQSSQHSVVKNSHKSVSSGRKGKNTNRERESHLAPLTATSHQNGSAVLPSDSASQSSVLDHRDELISRLETDVKRLKADLQQSRSSEQETRSQLSSLSSSEHILQTELFQLRSDNETLQNKLHNLVTNRQQDKQSMASLDRRLHDERQLRLTTEQQLAKARKAEETAQAKATALLQQRSSECTAESCKSRRVHYETEVRQLKRENKVRDEQVAQLEREVASLRQYKEKEAEVETLMKALIAMQDKNSHLESSLSNETKFKLDLFYALGEANRTIEIQQNFLSNKDKEIAELQSKITEAMACGNGSLPTSSSEVSSLVSNASPHSVSPQLGQQAGSNSPSPTASSSPGL